MNETIREALDSKVGFNKSGNTTQKTRRRESMIQLNNVEKTIKSPAGTIWLLRRINLHIKEGEFVTIMGPSGAGKTTLLSIVGLLDDGWAGEYTLLDQPVHKMDRKRRAELNRKYIGFVFQSYHLLDNLTVQENIDVPLSYRDIPRSQRAAMVADILDRFQIVGKKDLYPNQLSGGQQQLVGVARAVAGNPKLILADEPTGNLHSGQAQEIMELFRRLNQQGTTILQVTHSEVNASYGNRVIQLKDGWIVGDSANVTETVTA
jgi:ABC-type lipoprotein export system ATPase subunit